VLQTTDRQTGGRATAISEREREFTFAKNHHCRLLLLLSDKRKCSEVKVLKCRQKFISLQVKVKYFSFTLLQLSKSKQKLLLHSDALLLLRCCTIIIIISKIMHYHKATSKIKEINLLWPPCVADANIIFLPCGFFFYLLFSLSNLSRHGLDVYHTCTHGVALVRI